MTQKAAEAHSIFRLKMELEKFVDKSLNKSRNYEEDIYPLKSAKHFCVKGPQKMASIACSL